MSDLDHARELLEMSRSDLMAMKGMLLPDPKISELYFSDEVFGFHAQQCAEKCLKAWIAGLGDNYAKSHDLLALILKLASLGEDTTGLSELADLNPFAVQYRYESLDLDEDDLDRPRLLETIEQLFERVEMLLA